MRRKWLCLFWFKLTNFWLRFWKTSCNGGYAVCVVELCKGQEKTWETIAGSE